MVLSRFLSLVLSVFDSLNFSFDESIEGFKVADASW